MALIDNGWLYLSNGTDVMNLSCVEIKWDAMREPEIIHETGPWNYGYDLNVDYIIVKVSRIVFKTKADHTIFETNMREWLKSGVVNLKIQRTKAGAYEPIDGTNTQIQVLCPKGWSDVQKISAGDQERYVVGKCVFEEAGIRS